MGGHFRLQVQRLFGGVMVEHAACHAAGLRVGGWAGAARVWMQHGRVGGCSTGSPREHCSPRTAVSGVSLEVAAAASLWCKARVAGPHAAPPTGTHSSTAMAATCNAQQRPRLLCAAAPTHPHPHARHLPTHLRPKRARPPSERHPGCTQQRLLCTAGRRKGGGRGRGLGAFVGAAAKVRGWGFSSCF